MNIRTAVLVALLLCGALPAFSQDEITQRGSIPEELLRPRREEAPRYPIDMVIGTLGQGQAPSAAYGTARKIAAALLAGTMDAPILSPVNRVFLEGCVSKLQEINPRSFRLGGGREEPDGSVSFLIRFTGREQGITGELFIRFEEQQPAPVVSLSETESDSANTSVEVSESTPENSSVETSEGASTIVSAEVSEAVSTDQQPAHTPAEKVWLFEDLILEEARGREEENAAGSHRFDFPPYERFF